jgi:hypothetical protein
MGAPFQIVLFHCNTGKYALYAKHRHVFVFLQTLSSSLYASILFPLDGAGGNTHPSKDSLSMDT